MATKQGTGISWTWWPGTRGETWTVVRGCLMAKYTDPTTGKRKPFKTCVGCYAMALAHSLVERFDMPQYRGLTEKTSSGAVWNGNIYFDEEQLTWPLQCTKPRTFFLTSMGDIAYSKVTDEQIARIMAVMVVAWMRGLKHNFLVLTKRPDRLSNLLSSAKFKGLVMHFVATMEGNADKLHVEAALFKGRIWWGASVEGQASVDWAISQLAGIPAPKRRWISFEPMIEYVDLSIWMSVLSWIVIGGASKQRGVVWPFDLAGARKIMALCKRRRVPFYLKQLGAEIVNGGTDHIRLLDRHDNHNADQKYWPVDLARAQEFPEDE